MEGFKWGTPGPFRIRDKEFGILEMIARGSFTLHVSDASRFIKNVVGTDGEFTKDEIKDRLRKRFVTEAISAIGGSGKSFYEMAEHYDELSQELRERVTVPFWEKYGLTVDEVNLQNIDLTESSRQKVALADGIQDQKEMNLINTFANVLGVTLYEAERCAYSVLKAVDESGGYKEDENALEAMKELPTLSVGEAGLLMAILAAFGDDNPSEQETAVIREHYSPELLIAVRNKLENAGFEWPGKQDVMLPAIQKALEAAERSVYLKTLAVSWKTCNADGIIEPAEKEFLELFCRDLGIGIVEVGDFFKTSVV